MQKYYKWAAQLLRFAKSINGFNLEQPWWNWQNHVKDRPRKDQKTGLQ